MRLVRHHYIYDESDLSKYTVLISDSDHAKLHQNMRMFGIEIPHINEKWENQGRFELKRVYDGGKK